MEFWENIMSLLLDTSNMLVEPMYGENLWRNFLDALKETMNGDEKIFQQTENLGEWGKCIHFQDIVKFLHIPQILHTYTCLFDINTLMKILKP